MQDEQAVARLKQGDLQSLEPLVARYYLPAVRAAYLILLDKGLAEDTVQTSFLNLASTIQRYDSRRPFGPWFLRCVVNAAINTNHRENRLISMDALEESTFSAEEWLREQADGPAEQAETIEKRQAVQAALARLSPQQRAAVVMRYFLDLSEDEMAAELDCPKSSLKWWLYSARLRLRELLHAYTPADLRSPSNKEKRQ